MKNCHLFFKFSIKRDFRQTRNKKITFEEGNKNYTIPFKKNLHKVAEKVEFNFFLYSIVFEKISIELWSPCISDENF